MVCSIILWTYQVCSNYDFITGQIIGSQFVRDPPGSTERFTKWANEMAQEQLITQVWEF